MRNQWKIKKRIIIFFEDKIKAIPKMMIDDSNEREILINITPIKWLLVVYNFINVNQAILNVSY